MANQDGNRFGKDLVGESRVDEDGGAGGEGNGEAGLVRGLAARCGSLSLVGVLEVGGLEEGGRSDASGDGSGEVGLVGGLEADSGSGMAFGLATGHGSFVLPGINEGGIFSLSGKKGAGGSSVEAVARVSLMAKRCTWGGVVVPTAHSWVCSNWINSRSFGWYGGGGLLRGGRDVGGGWSWEYCWWKGGCALGRVELGEWRGNWDVRRVAAGGGAFKGENDTKIHIPAANLNDIANQANDLLVVLVAGGGGEWRGDPGDRKVFNPFSSVT